MHAIATFTLASVLIVMTIDPAAATDDLIPSKTGFRASIGTVETQLELPIHTAAALADVGVPLETRSVGLQLDLGWSVSPRVSIDARLAGGDNDRREASLTPSVVSFFVEARTRLRPGHRVDPWLVAGFGGVGIGFGEPPVEESTLAAGAFALGAGVDVRLSPRWAMSFSLRQATLEFDRQVVALPGVAGDPIEISGDAALTQVGFGVDFRL